MRRCRRRADREMCRTASVPAGRRFLNGDADGHGQHRSDRDHHTGRLKYQGRVAMVWSCLSCCSLQAASAHPSHPTLNTAVTGSLIWSRIKANPTAAANSAAMMRHGSGSIKVPDNASVETMAMSATDAAKDPIAGLRTPHASPLPQHVQHGLVSEHERDERQRLQLPRAEPEPELSDRQNRGGKAELAYPEDDAAAVILRMRQTLGDGAELARSVVSDMARKSLVTNSRTISTGVMIAWPVMPSPIARKEDDLDLLDQHVERVGQQPLETRSGLRGRQARCRRVPARSGPCRRRLSRHRLRRKRRCRSVPVAAPAHRSTPSPHMPTTWP